MSNAARVDSIDSLRSFRVALIKFGEEANTALASAEAEMQRMLGWLERDQLSFWQFQLRKRQEGLGRAQEALRQKKLFPDASGRFPTPIEEEKAVRKWKAAVEEAETKLAACKKYARLLQREIMNYKGGVNRFATAVQAEVPGAVARLDRMVDKLDAYVSLGGGTSSSSAPLREASVSAFGPTDAPAGNMARPPAETPADDPPAQPATDSESPPLKDSGAPDGPDARDPA